MIEHKIFEIKHAQLIDFQAGCTILIDKPLDWTSFDVVNKLRFKLRMHTGNKKIKVGHAGTLDPLASGLLIICTGKLTKQIDLIQAQTKVYSGHITLGATTDTYDSEVEPNQYYNTEHIDQALIEKARGQFVGLIEQVPPIYSAIKIKGQKAYDLARRGADVVMASRRIEIYDFQIGERVEDTMAFEVTCSKGTYIRSLAHDFGRACSSGAYLSSLRRKKIGDYDVKDAVSIDQFIDSLGG
jgi:tRNA pseudouridine55 synthase